MKPSSYLKHMDNMWSGGGLDFEYFVAKWNDAGKGEVFLFPFSHNIADRFYQSERGLLLATACHAAFGLRYMKDYSFALDYNTLHVFKMTDKSIDYRGELFTINQTEDKGSGRFCHPHRKYSLSWVFRFICRAWAVLGIRRIKSVAFASEKARRDFIASVLHTTAEAVPRRKPGYFMHLHTPPEGDFFSPVFRRGLRSSYHDGATKLPIEADPHPGSIRESRSTPVPWERELPDGSLGKPVAWEAGVFLIIFDRKKYESKRDLRQSLRRKAQVEYYLDRFHQLEPFHVSHYTKRAVHLCG